MSTIPPSLLLGGTEGANTNTHGRDMPWSVHPKSVGKLLTQSRSITEGPRAAAPSQYVLPTSSLRLCSQEQVSRPSLEMMTIGYDNRRMIDTPLPLGRAWEEHTCRCQEQPEQPATSRSKAKPDKHCRSYSNDQ